MEYMIGASIAFSWLSIGFGTRAVFKSADHWIWDFPLLIIIWPLVLFAAAFIPAFVDKE